MLPDRTLVCCTPEQSTRPGRSQRTQGPEEVRDPKLMPHWLHASPRYGVPDEGCRRMTWLPMLVYQKVPGYACYSHLNFNNSLFILEKNKNKTSPGLHHKLHTRPIFVGHLCNHPSWAQAGSSPFELLHLYCLSAPARPGRISVS